MNLRLLTEIYGIFFKMGAVTFGGGYAMLPILEREVVENKKWATKEEIMDYYAVSQALPGIIAVNVSVFIGHRKAGIAGAVAAALGMISPCILIITIIAACLSNFQNNVYVKRALAGISVCVSALILHAVVGLWKKGVTDLFGVVIFATVFLCTLFLDLSPILYVLTAAGLGIAFRRMGGKRA